jgi:hypothetical protein
MKLNSKKIYHTYALKNAKPANKTIFWRKVFRCNIQRDLRAWECGEKPFSKHQQAKVKRLTGLNPEEYLK